MKTSTKNAIITGIFSLIAGTMAGYALNADMQNNKVENMINQSGLVNINNGSSIGDIVSALLEKILEDQKEIKDLSIEVTLQKDQNIHLSEQVDELSEMLAGLQEENKQLKTAALDNSAAELDYAIQDVEEKEYKSLLSECEPYYMTDYVHIIESNIKMCGVSYSNGLKMACDGYYALFNLDGNYEKMRFQVGHVDGTNMEYGEIHIYVDKLDSSPVQTIAVEPDGLVENYEIDLNGAKQLKIETVADEASIWVGIVNIEVK